MIRNAKPTVLIGVSGQAGPLPKRQCVKWRSIRLRPVIFPLSNPTSRSEATPQDLMDWTEGRALIGTGSPFEPVNVGGKRCISRKPITPISFPGSPWESLPPGQGMSPTRWSKPQPRELIRHLPTQKDKEGSLLPPLSEARQLGRLIGAGGWKTSDPRWPGAGDR